jgi:hypothetical protein
MTEIAIRDDQTSALAALPDYQDAAFTRLAQWANSARAAHTVAQSLVKTSFVPEAFRNRPDEATAAILSGAEVGLSPMAALRSFDVIQGTAAPRANTLRAIVQSRGHEMVLTEATATRAIVKGRRRGEQNWQQSTWTIDRAAKLGLTNKSNWKNQPQAMLVARATAECARLIASDAILGIPYASEELIDGDTQPGATLTVDSVPEVKPARRTAQRAPRAAVEVPEPELGEPAADVMEAAAYVAGEPITAPQQKMLHALLRKANLGEREAGLAAIAAILGRDVESTKDLSKADATIVIDELVRSTEEPIEPTLDDDWPPTAEPAS